jgi:hypothetical protein
MADLGKMESSAGIGPVQRWTREIDASEKALQSFKTAAPKVVARYLAKTSGAGTGEGEAMEFPIFWSNVNILKAAMYARMPKADVSRRFKDAQDDVGRVAGEIIERILNADMQAEQGDIDSALRHVIEDRLVPGLGQVWLRYEPTIIETEQPGEDADYGDGEDAPMQGPVPGTEIEKEESNEPPERFEQIVDEKVATDYVHWNDFLWSPARTWEEVRWVARRTWMTRDELVERFGKLGELVPLGSAKSGGKDAEAMGALRDDPWQKAGVWEIWCKTTRRVHFFVKGFDQLMEDVPDPLNLPGFWPCPRPMLANISTSGLVPRADHSVLRKVYSELEMVSQRVGLLEEAIRVVGVYDKNNSELRTVLTRTGTNQMIPVDSWAAFAEKGGVKGAIDWLPLDMIVEALTQLRAVKAGLMQELYELTGLSDIMRGATDPGETATAQQLKSQFASVRLQYMQGEFARFVQDLLTIKAEIMAGHFQPQTLIQKSMIDKSFDAQHAEAAVALLRDKRLSQYSLIVAPDSMAMMDYQAEQRAAQEFLQAFAAFLAQAAPLAQQIPSTLPFLLQMLGAVVARFRFGKQVESILDQAVAQALAQPPKPPEPSPLEQATVAEKASKAKLNEANAAKAQGEAKRQPAIAAYDLASARKLKADSIRDTVGGVVDILRNPSGGSEGAPGGSQ